MRTSITRHLVRVAVLFLLIGALLATAYLLSPPETATPSDGSGDHAPGADAGPAPTCSPDSCPLPHRPRLTAP